MKKTSKSGSKTIGEEMRRQIQGCW